MIRPLRDIFPRCLWLCLNDTQVSVKKLNPLQTTSCASPPLLLISAVSVLLLPQSWEECCCWRWMWPWFCEEQKYTELVCHATPPTLIQSFWQTYFSPETLLVSLASVPFISSSHPPDTLGRLLFFWIFFSSLISSDRKSPKALSPEQRVYGFIMRRDAVCLNMSAGKPAENERNLLCGCAKTSRLILWTGLDVSRVLNAQRLLAGFRAFFSYNH